MPATIDASLDRQPKLARVHGVEIFQAGELRPGVVYTIADLDQMVKNFFLLQGLVDPPVVVGHDDDQSFLQDSGYPAAGTVERIWRGTRANGEEEDKLYADFANVPVLVARLIEARSYSKISPEVYDEPPPGCEGRGAEGRTLRRVALLGAELPQIKTIAELPAKYFGDGAAEFCSVQHRKAALRYQEVRPGRDGTFHVFYEVIPVAHESTRKRSKRDAFSDKAKAVWQKFAEEQTMPEAAGPAPAGVSREDMLAMLMEYGYDPAFLEKLDDAGLAELIRVNKTMMAQMAQAPQPGTVNAEPSVQTPPIQSAPVPSQTIPGMPNATPSQVTLKFGEKDVPIQVIKPFIDATVADAVRSIRDELTVAQSNVEKFRESQHKAGVDARIDLLLKQGKVLPRHIDAGLKELLYSIDGVKKFSDGKSALDKWFDVLEANPAALKFGDRVKSSKSGDADAEKQKVERFAEEHADALKKGGKTKEAFVTGFLEARKKRPDMTAAHYGVPDTIA